MSEPVLYSVKNAVATVTLNSPATRNALTVELAACILAAIKKADQDPKVRCIVITGSGKGFSAGANLKGAGDMDFSKPELIGRGSHDVLVGIFGDVVKSLVRASKPVIAAVNGVAAGAGASLALAADFRVMTPESAIYQAFINVSLAPDAGSSFFLTRLIGYSKALEITVEGKPVLGQRCYELGLTNKLVPNNQELLTTAQKWGEALAQKGSFGLMASKRCMQFALVNKSLDEIVEHEAIWQSYAAGSPDNMEGVMAFWEKRTPTFAGPAPNAPSSLTHARL